MGLFLGFLSCSIDLYFCFCASTVLMTAALYYNLKSERLIPPAPFFFLKTAYAIQDLLCFYMSCEIFCSSSVKNTIGNLIEPSQNLQIAFGSIVIFTILILPTWEQMLSFKPAFSLSYFTFIKRLFSSSLLSAIRVVSPGYLRLLIFLLTTLIPACDSSSLELCMMFSAQKLNKQGDSIQP